MDTLRGKIAIVTGSNTGIGKETARGLAAAGARVVLACRDLGKAESARAELAAGGGDVVAMPLDLGDLQSIDRFASDFGARFDRLDILVNNAGVWTTKRATTKQGFETTFGVNHLGTFALTRGLLPMLEKSAPSRVVVVSSALHYRGKMAWDDLQSERRKFDGMGTYAQSKLANVLFTKALARRESGKGVTVNAVHPGVVATELARDYPKFLVKIAHLFMLTPERGAACSLHVATAPELRDVSGEYFEKSKTKPAAREARDEAAQERLWQITEELLAGRAASAAA